jgi:hypothetical protein
MVDLEEPDKQIGFSSEFEVTYRRVPMDRGHLVLFEYPFPQMVSWEYSQDSKRRQD